jgi:hypothetical protein
MKLPEGMANPSWVTPAPRTSMRRSRAGRTPADQSIAPSTFRTSGGSRSSPTRRAQASR